MGLTSESSSEDDDIYLNPAARLKALKKKTPVVVDDDPDFEEDEESPDFWKEKSFASLHKESPPSDRHVRPSKVSLQDLRNNATENEESSNQKRKISKKRETERTEETKRERDYKKRESSPEVVETTIKEEEIQKFSTSIDSLNCSSVSANLEDDNYNVVVNVKWRSRKVVRLELRKYEPFETIFKHFAELEGVPLQQVLIWRGTQAIHRTDTPASIDFRIIDILEGGIVDSGIAGAEQQQQHQQNKEDANLCKIKVQMSTKQKIIVNLRMDETFKTVVLTCSEQLNVKPSQIKLSFDGDEITMSDTPESLDLEQEACIDLRLLTT